ncbi:zinc finger protein [Streptomyces sp. NPDC058855]|uniref:zinc finger protein n=1 Tax=Streptomyces sp. NPDC058855 TaxID=3346651 RepID=UPI0036AE370E
MAGSANWKCADCDNNNGPKDAACSICGSTRRAPMPRPAAPSRPAAKRPSPARPAGDWQCGVCRASNSARNLSCVGCGKSWRTSAGPARKPSSPGTSTPRRTAPGASTTKPRTPSTPASGSGTGGTGRAAPRRAATPGTSGTGGSGGRPTGVFYPPPGGTGYTPTPPRRTAPPAPAPPSRPVYTPPYRPPAKKKSNGCLAGCLTLIGALVALGVASSVFRSFEESDADGSRPTARPSATAASCPSRVAEALPKGEGAELVDAFHTEDHRITLCETASGQLYYYGEFRDGREPGIAMKARRTSGGYEATNSPYRYVIRDGTVSIYKSGSRIGREEVTPVPSPS